VFPYFMYIYCILVYRPCIFLRTGMYILSYIRYTYEQIIRLLVSNSETFYVFLFQVSVLLVF